MVRRNIGERETRKSSTPEEVSGGWRAATQVQEPLNRIQEVGRTQKSPTRRGSGRLKSQNGGTRRPRKSLTLEQNPAGRKSDIEAQESRRSRRPQNRVRKDVGAQNRRKQAAGVADSSIGSGRMERRRKAQKSCKSQRNQGSVREDGRSKRGKSCKSRRLQGRFREDGKPQHRRKKAAKNADPKIGSGRLESRRIGARRPRKSQTPG